MAKNIVVEQIKRLSQDEGLTDSEIGEELGYARASIQRIRKQNHIPIANMENRKDKECICLKCNKTFLVRRNTEEKQIHLCDECKKEDEAKYNKIIREKQRNS